MFDNLLTIRRQDILRILLILSIDLSNSSEIAQAFSEDQKPVTVGLVVSQEGGIS